MEILVIGGTGTVGTHAVRGLVERGESPRVMTREPSKGSVDGATYVEGRLGDADSVRAALEGMEAALMITPLHPEEAEIGVEAVNLMADAGIERLVLQTVQGADTIPDAPHFAAKVRIEEAVAERGIPYTVVAPNSFFQNDLRTRDPIVEHGVYPQPLGGVGLSRVDVRDIADAHVRALLDVRAGGRTYTIAGPDVWTAEEIAEAWGEALGRDVAYAGDDLDVWADRMGGLMPDWMIRDLKKMYAAFQERGLIASQADLASSRNLVGHEGRSFADFAAETAEAWRG